MKILIVFVELNTKKTRQKIRRFNNLTKLDFSFNFIIFSFCNIFLYKSSGMYYNYVIQIKIKHLKGIRYMNRIKVVICGKEYTLQTEEESIYVYSLAKKLEKKITDIPNASAYNASVMVGFSLLDELQKAKEEISGLRSQINDYIDEASKARMERDDALRENAILRGKVSKLESDIKLKQLKDSI